LVHALDLHRNADLAHGDWYHETES
jgi:hypothetical protein